MPKTTKTKPTSAFKWRQLLLMLTGFIAAFVFTVRLTRRPDVNLTNLENEMNSSATSMIFLDPARNPNTANPNNQATNETSTSEESTSGQSSDFESTSTKYYSAQGDYLVSESIAWNYFLTTLSDLKISLDIIGLIASIAIFILGTRLNS